MSFEITKIDSLYRTGEFWTSGQRQAQNIHEISYRACFKPQLPAYFIEKFSVQGDKIYDPFAGRGTTAVEAALRGRNPIQNDLNPLSEIFTKPRLCLPSIDDIKTRLSEIPIKKNLESNKDLSMFYHIDTFDEILSLREYFHKKDLNSQKDCVDLWIQMVATNRLTGHSPGFFSVYTLPPNQAVSIESQKKINIKRGQNPTYRDTKALIYKKSKQLQKNLSPSQVLNLRNASKSAKFYSELAHETKEIADESIQLVVTSPPFLDIVQYVEDNWLRCWFNNIDANAISETISSFKHLDDWSSYMQKVLHELYRVVKLEGVVAFEVGEVRNGKIKLDESILPLGLQAGFTCEEVLINQQSFTKTSNIWGVKNNTTGTNSNRIVVFRKFT